MADCKAGKQSIVFSNPPVIKAWASVAGRKEGDGPLKTYYDHIENDPYFAQKTWEQAEQMLQIITLNTVLKKGNCDRRELDCVISGDLLNQCAASSFPLRNRNTPHLGLYGACSTMAESLNIAAMAISGGFSDHIVSLASSHFAASERQYRFPLGYGGQRTTTAQWTVTGAGALLLSSNGDGPKIVNGTIGSITDLGITDANNMGAAMAPAALQTILSHFDDLSLGPEDYDFIVTGDLGNIGREILLTISADRGLSLQNKLIDCGDLVFDRQRQDVHAGGSGCGCSALVLCSYFMKQLQEQKIKSILFCGTGALLSPTTVQQGLSIPGICHAVAIKGV